MIHLKYNKRYLSTVSEHRGKASDRSLKSKYKLQEFIVLFLDQLGTLVGLCHVIICNDGAVEIWCI